ncbi:MAG TPA: DUF3857 domain-containing protein [Thermoanaerobaculia bacterium]
MRRSSRSLGVSALALVAAAAAAVPARAATFLERTIDAEIAADGTLRQHTRLAVRLTAPADMAAWAVYPIALDQNRKLESLEAYATTPDGKRQNVRRKDQDEVEYAGEGVLHSSHRAHTVTFPSVPVGSVLTLDYTTKGVPYFPASQVALGGADPVEKLRITVRGAAAGFRFRIDGPRDGLAVAESPGGVTVTAAALPGVHPPPLAPGWADERAVLRFAWGAASTWPDVGRWYQGLVGALPQDAALQAKARELAGSRKTPRERLAALLAFLRHDVRYVAVEVGIGGYRPSPPQQVLERRWGDCKDKALLLVSLLREVGIEAYPVLILSSDDERIDGQFPAATQFNHAIVALPSEGVALPDDPVAEGYLFVDPTQEHGGIRWLHPGVQDQDALVARPDGGVLVRTPTRQRFETEALTVELKAADGGVARGEARVDLTGESGAAFVEHFAASKPTEAERAVREVLGRLLPGADLERVQWSVDPDAELPAATLRADIRLPGIGTTPSFALPAAVGAPAVGLLDSRTDPVVLQPHTRTITWKIELPPDLCPAKAETQTTENPVGLFRQSITSAGRTLTVERRLELRERWIEPARFSQLKEVALAELRASKRRLHLACDEGEKKPQTP